MNEPEAPPAAFGRTAVGQPSFSILTPSYNYGRFIGEAIASVTAQIEHVAEHIVQDAQSPDNTRTVVQDHAHDRLVFRSEADSGQSDALNRALQIATGAWVGWLNADEYYLPDTLQAVARFATSRPDVGVIFGDCEFVDADGEHLRVLASHRPSNFVLRHYGCFMSSCAVFIRRDLLSPGSWDESLRRTLDWDLWLSLSERTEFAYLPKILSAFRVHEDQITAFGSSTEADVEISRLRMKHGIRSNRALRALARAQHRWLKVLDGGYGRQAAARSAQRQVGA